jgi:hypothetical protein
VFSHHTVYDEISAVFEHTDHIETLCLSEDYGHLNNILLLLLPPAPKLQRLMIESRGLPTVPPDYAVDIPAEIFLGAMPQLGEIALVGHIRGLHHLKPSHLTSFTGSIGDVSIPIEIKDRWTSSLGGMHQLQKLELTGTILQVIDPSHMDFFLPRLIFLILLDHIAFISQFIRTLKAPSLRGIKIAAIAHEIGPGSMADYIRPVKDFLLPYYLPSQPESEYCCVVVPDDDRESSVSPVISFHLSHASKQNRMIAASVFFHSFATETETTLLSHALERLSNEKVTVLTAELSFATSLRSILLRAEAQTVLDDVLGAHDLDPLHPDRPNATLHWPNIRKIGLKFDFALGRQREVGHEICETLQKRREHAGCSLPEVILNVCSRNLTPELRLEFERSAVLHVEMLEMKQSGQNETQKTAEGCTSIDDVAEKGPPSIHDGK